MRSPAKRGPSVRKYCPEWALVDLFTITDTLKISDTEAIGMALRTLEMVLAAGPVSLRRFEGGTCPVVIGYEAYMKPRGDVTPPQLTQLTPVNSQPEKSPPSEKRPVGRPAKEVAPPPPLKPLIREYEWDDNFEPAFPVKEYEAQWESLVRWMRGEQKTALQLRQEWESIVKTPVQKTKNLGPFGFGEKYGAWHEQFFAERIEATGLPIDPEECIPPTPKQLIPRLNTKELATAWDRAIVKACFPDGKNRVNPTYDDIKDLFMEVYAAKFISHYPEELEEFAESKRRN